MQYRLSGDHGIRPVTANASVSAKLSSALALLSLVAISCLSLLEFLGVLHAQWALGLAGSLLGSLFCGLGIGLTVLAQYQMGPAWRIGVQENEQTRLVVQGLYARCRNPIYLGILMFGFGLLLLMPHLFMLISAIVAYGSIELQVRFVEEPYLKRWHGGAFDHYVRTVNRYWPFRHSTNDESPL